ncbi:OPT super [Yamadazyma tenuis]|nr:OPT super [Yamadazyma tenuis]
MMSLPSALLGFAIFKLSPFSNDFTDVENVYVQSIAVAVGTGPLAYGLIGIIPAMEHFLTSDESGLGRTLHFSTTDLIVWSLGLGFFGVFFAIPLRKQVIVKEKLPFPSGNATGILISVLHGTSLLEEEFKSDAPDVESNEPEEQNQVSLAANDANYKSNIRSLSITFVASAVYTIVSFFIPILKSLPVFGSYASEAFLWNLQPSPAYIGQGIIMGLPTVSYMLFGAILGWGVLSPLAKYQGWAPGEVDDWKTGSQGWIMWISLSIMISDSLVSFMVMAARSVSRLVGSARRAHSQYQPLLGDRGGDGDNASVATSYDTGLDPRHLVSDKASFVGIAVSSIICAISLKFIFGQLVPLYTILIAVVMALFFSILAVRALGETDLNPVSGIGKLSQLIFAVIVPSNHPSKILINLMAGGIAEAGAQQAGDLMQDLKAGHLLGASPKAQTIAQLTGTVYSIFLSSIMYKVYNSVYEIPSKMFRIPTAVIWIDCARLVTGEGLPPNAWVFSLVFGVIFGVISLLKNIIPKESKNHKYLFYLPSGVAVGIGIYNTPNFTLARFIGGLVTYIQMKKTGSSNQRVHMIILSSGLVLGEGLFSCFTMLLTSLGVKPL